VADGVRDEVSSGRARDRVLSDMRLAIRLGVVTTPTFVLDGTLLTGEEGLVESRLFERHGISGSGKP
jgi:protein-disulfide isomerase